ncbi:capsular polysaccharide export protein, LipB/KpsS family [Rhizobium sp. G187]|uniref:capsular polysaccharide export protein, LipB/KpsS family n=1 Tax=Rhizobium sp. G187 TaxID=3451352 RepID=UPI003EE73F6A
MVSLFRKATGAISLWRGRRSEARFVSQNLERRKADWLHIKRLFPHPNCDRRLIVLTDQKNLYGRRHFVNSLSRNVTFHIPSDLSEDDVVLVFGYTDFLKNSHRILNSRLRNVFFVEAGFLRSVLMDNSGSDFDTALAFFFDDVGFHYDSRSPSRIEFLLNDPSFSLSLPELERASAIRSLLVANKLTKYNDQSSQFSLPSSGRPRVLVVEQARQDWAVLKSGGGASSFDHMLKTAIDQNPGAEILVKAHPDTLNGKRGGLDKSYYGQLVERDQVRLIVDKVNPFSVLAAVDKVYVFSSMLGFEALLMGKETHVFGEPIYAGWGASVDYRQFPQRRTRRQIDELVYIIYVKYQMYKNLAGEWCEVEDAVAELLRLRNEYWSDVGAKERLEC